ncbi:MAG: hypothetical protein JWO22_2357 [Frankiales bacterium]|nr:hypothetical protein [Frankiales bacterium]
MALCESGPVKVPELLRRLLLPGLPPTVPFPGGKPGFDRVTAYVYRHFAEPQRVLAALKDLPDEAYGGQDRERITAALVLLAQGSWEGLEKALAVAATDWRDLLVWSGLGNPDWPQRLDDVLGAR